MRNRLITISAAFAIALAAVPLSAANAQFYPPPCSPFPLALPFCAVGAAVGAAAIILTAPFRALTGAPPFFYGYYGPPYYPVPVYLPARYYPPPNYYAPR